MKFELKADLSEVKELEQKWPIVSQRVRKEEVNEALSYMKSVTKAGTPVGPRGNRRSKKSIEYGPLKEGYKTRIYEPRNIVYGVLANNVFYGRAVNYGSKFITGQRFFEKGIKSSQSRAQSILKEIPNEIVKRVQ